MSRMYKVLCLNGPNKGKEIEVNEDYSAREEEKLKNNKKFTYEGIKYAGMCRKCGKAIVENKAEYISNTNYFGDLSVDVFHRWCL